MEELQRISEAGWFCTCRAIGSSCPCLAQTRIKLHDAKQKLLLSAVHNQELASLHARVEELETTLVYALAQLDGFAALQVSLGELEHRLECAESLHLPLSKRKRFSIRRLLARVVLSGVLSLQEGWVVAWRLLAQAKGLFTSPPAASGKLSQSRTNLTLIMQGVTWLEAQTIKGKKLHYGLLKPGRYLLPFQQPLRLRAGRPDLVTLAYAGESRKLASMMETGWHVLSPIP